MLIILSGLPGTGKTTIARDLARKLAIVHLRIDTIEQALRNKGLTVVDEGYRVAYALAEGNLRLGLTVIADSVNPLQITREAWRNVATRASTRFIDVEIICSNTEEHRRRVEDRKSDIANHRLPTWDDVIKREYHAWHQNRLVIDTTIDSTQSAVAKVCAAIA